MAEQGAGASSDADDKRSRLMKFYDNVDNELLDCVQVTPEHIRANGTLHTTAFAGVAELVDNSVDSGATNVKIEMRKISREERNTVFNKDGKADSSEKEFNTVTEKVLCVSDDGRGMHRHEALSTILIGYSMKRGDVNNIGQFGNGLKSGSMRLGNTMLLLTKKLEVYTFLLLSLKYLDDTRSHKCYVPCISFIFNEKGEREFRTTRDESENKFSHAEQVMLEYSVFRKKDDLYEFAKTAFVSLSGTMVAVSDLKMLEDGSRELRLHKDDLVVNRREGGKTSRLSEYLQMLYLEPKISLQIMDKMVNLQDPRRTFAHRRWNFVLPKGHAKFSDREKERLTQQNNLLEHEYGKALTEDKDMVCRMQSYKANHDAVQIKTLGREMRIHRTKKEEIEKQMKEIKQRITKASSKDLGKELRVYMGIDLRNRQDMQVTFYSNGRRIVSVPFDLRLKNNRDVFGVSCVMDIPSTLLPPSQNRENYETPSDLAFLMRKIASIAKEYYSFAPQQFKDRAFWQDIGYSEKPDSRAARNSAQSLKVLKMTGVSQLCYKCHQFRDTEVTEEIPMLVPLPGFCCPVAPNGVSCSNIQKKEIRDANIQFTRDGKPTKYPPPQRNEPIVPIERPIDTRRVTPSNIFAQKRRTDDDLNVGVLKREPGVDDEEPCGSSMKIRKTTRNSVAMSPGEDSPMEVEESASLRNFKIPKKGEDKKRQEPSGATIRQSPRTTRRAIKESSSDEEEFVQQPSSSKRKTIGRRKRVKQERIDESGEEEEEEREEAEQDSDDSIQILNGPVKKAKSQRRVPAAASAASATDKGRKRRTPAEIDPIDWNAVPEAKQRLIDLLNDISRTDMAALILEYAQGAERAADNVKQWFTRRVGAQGDVAATLRMDAEEMEIAQTANSLQKLEEVLSRRRDGSPNESLPLL